MIHVTPAPEPERFDRDVRKPGLRALAEMVGESPLRRSGKRLSKIADRREDIPSDKFPPYWTKLSDELRQAYHEICAYSCFRIHPVTGATSVDHFAPKSLQWDRVYEWSNYRLACSRLNSGKCNYQDVLDPFEIEDGWFQLELVGYQVKPADHLSDELREKIQATIDRLGLNDFRKDREERAMDYLNGEVSLEILQREAPFVARELARQGKCRQEAVLRIAEKGYGDVE